MKVDRYPTEWRVLQVALLLCGGLLIYSLYEEHNEIRVQERDRLQVQLQVIDENLVHQLSGVNNALAGILDDFPNWDSKTLGRAAADHRLRDLAGAMPGVRAIFILDANGTVTSSNRDELSGRNFNQWEHFTIPRERLDPATLHVSQPLKIVGDTPSITIGRARISIDGRFAGVVSAALDSEYFRVLLRSILYAPDMRAGLTHGDGKTFLNISRDSQSPERDLSQPDSFFSRHLASGQTSTVLLGTSHASGEERMIAQRTINPDGLDMDKPVIISVSRGLPGVYATWRRRALELGGIFGVIALTTSIALYAIQHRRQEFDRLSLGMDAQSREGSERMRLVLAGADVGLWEWDLTNDKITFNDRWRAMLGYAFGEIHPDISSWQKLLHPDDWTSLHAALGPHLKGETTEFEAEYRMRHANGEWIWILGRGKVLERDAAGAAVRFMGTHMDITGRKRR